MTKGARRAGWGILLVAAGCGPSRVNLDPASIQVPAAERLMQGQVASIVAAVNSAQIRNGQVAAQRGASETVRTYGARLVEEHSDLNTGLARAMQAASVPAGQHWLVQQVTDRQAAIERSLEGTAGTQFDRAFMRRQRDFTRWLVAVLDHTLLPSASSDQLRDYLEGARTVAAGHLAVTMAAAPR